MLVIILTVRIPIREFRTLIEDLNDKEIQMYWIIGIKKKEIPLVLEFQILKMRMIRGKI